MKTTISKSKPGLLVLLFSIVISCHSQDKTISKEDEEITAATHISENTNSQIGEYIIKIFEDSKGNLWFGTLAKGVAKYDGNQLRYYTSEDGLNGNRVGSIVEDTNGNLWFGTHSGLSKYDGQTFKNFNENDGLCDNRVSNLLLDNTGTLWIGTWGGVCKFEANEFLHFPLPNPDIELLPYQSTMNWLTEITEDSKGNIWFARGGYGACKYDGETFTHFTKADGLASNAISDIQEDAEGNIWFSSRVEEKDHPEADKRFGSGGLNRYDGETFIGFPDLPGLHNNDVNDIYRDSKDNIWIGTRDKGVYRYNGKQFSNYSGNNSENGFPKSVMCILVDSQEELWIGCAGGLFRNDSTGIVNVTIEGPWK